MSITTSYFAKSKNIEGKKISIARYNFPRIKENLDEILISFAPSQKLLRDYKQNVINWEKYTRIYLSEQEYHYKKSPEDFEKLLEKAENEDVVLLCYERFEGPKTKCHRMLLYDILKAIAKERRYATKFIDEM